MRSSEKDSETRWSLGLAIPVRIETRRTEPTPSLTLGQQQAAMALASMAAPAEAGAGHYPGAAPHGLSVLSLARLPHHGHSERPDVPRPGNM
jgi:hypothetical protein